LLEDHYGERWPETRERIVELGGDLASQTTPPLFLSPYRENLAAWESVVALTPDEEADMATTILKKDGVLSDDPLKALPDELTAGHPEFTLIRLGTSHGSSMIDWSALRSR